jgi:hypothetical protein
MQYDGRRKRQPVRRSIRRTAPYKNRVGGKSQASQSRDVDRQPVRSKKSSGSSRRTHGARYDFNRVGPSVMAIARTGKAIVQTHAEVVAEYAQTGSVQSAFMVGATGVVTNVRPTVPATVNVLNDVMYGAGMSNEAPSSWVQSVPSASPTRRVGPARVVRDINDPRTVQYKKHRNNSNDWMEYTGSYP